MFSWCKTCSAEPPGSGYLVFKDQQPPKFYQQFADIKEADLRNNKAAVLKVNKSDYETLSKALVGKDRKFTDIDFAPQEKSLGSFPNIPSDKWKRLSELVTQSNFIPKEEKPFVIAQPQQGKNKGFIAAVSALSESNERLRSLFGQSGVSQNGIYRFLLRHKGAVEEIVIDDYVPIDDKGQPYFTHQQQSFLWAPLLEKARAKLYGSYESMSKVTSPRQVLIETTLAPVDIIKSNAGSSQDIWLKIIAALANKFVLIGNSSNSQKINWESIGLTPGHHYTVIDAATLLHKFQNSFKVVKLRNAFKHEEYKGEGSFAVDPLFWDQVQETEEKKRLEGKESKEGIIYMLFSDYLKYFEETLINYYTPVRNYINQPCIFQSQNGLVYEVTILKEGDYSFCLDQAEMQVEKKGLEYYEQGWGRSTILIIKDNSSNVTEEYEFIDGTLKYNEQYSHIRAKLKPGKYIIYVKIDPTIKFSNFPKQISFAVCSSQTVQIKSSLQISYSDLLKKTFLAHGRANKRQHYNNNLMWASWKLIPQGGYAYMAFGNSSESHSKFVIKLKEEVFNKQNYTMKKPCKGKGEQVLQILPGQEEIILLRIKNSDVKQVNFPPPIDLQIIDL